MKFKSRKDAFFNIVIGATFLLLISVAVINFEFNNESIIASLVILFVLFFLGWMYFGTYYEISNNYIKYYCGPIRGKILISVISEIEKNKTLWVGYRPATAKNGLIIKYNKFDEIYLSPISNDAFIKELLNINSNIIIK